MNGLALRLGLALGAAGLVLAGSLYVRHLNGTIADLREAVRAAEAQATLNQTSGRITERVVRSEVTIHQKEERAADAVQSLPGASDALPDGFGAGLASELRGMRPQAPAGDDPALR